MDKASTFLNELAADDGDAITTYMEEERIRSIGTVLRTAARPFMEDKSRPGRPGYTTRKNSLPEILVDVSGVTGDYNDYRSRALSSTPDRAVSILTSDVLAYVKDESRFSGLSDGDLGENIYVDGLSYTFFEIGKRYRFSEKNSEEDGAPGVIIEITEPAVPCANLCNLQFINSGLLEPRQRIEKCQAFLEKLGIDDGFRGWYGKVISGGTIRPGDAVALIA